MSSLGCSKADAYEEVVTSQRGVSLELVVASKAGLASSQQWVDRCAGGGVTTDGQLLCEQVTVCLETEESQQKRKVVADCKPLEGFK